MRNLRGALPNTKWASQYGVLAGLRVKLIYGLAAPMHSRPRCPRRATQYPVSCTVGPSIDGWETNLGNWLGGRDSNPDNVVQSHVSYR